MIKVLREQHSSELLTLASIPCQLCPVPETLEQNRIHKLAKCDLVRIQSNDDRTARAYKTLEEQGGQRLLVVVACKRRHVLWGSVVREIRASIHACPMACASNRSTLTRATMSASLRLRCIHNRFKTYVFAIMEPSRQNLDCFQDCLSSKLVVLFVRSFVDTIVMNEIRTNHASNDGIGCGNGRNDVSCFGCIEEEQM